MSSRRRKFLWITGTWETLYPLPGETTLRLAEEAMAQGHECHWATVHSVRIEGGRVLVNARKFRRINPGRAEGDYDIASPRPVRPSAFFQTHYRTDPPVDLSYLHPLQILCRDEGATIINPPDVLFRVSEKFEPFALPSLVTPTVVAAEVEPLLRFIRKEGRAVLKPLHQAQSRGIELLDRREQDDASIRDTLAQATENFTRPALLQRYLPAIAEGETRLWFIDGKLLAHAAKLPVKGDFRVDIDRGSGLATRALTAREKKASDIIGRHLRKLGVRLAAIDLIEGKITDFNITSPGLIPQMEQLLGENLARPIMRALAK